MVAQKESPHGSGVSGTAQPSRYIPQSGKKKKSSRERRNKNLKRRLGEIAVPNEWHRRNKGETFKKKRGKEREKGIGIGKPRVARHWTPIPVLTGGGREGGGP